MTLSIPAAMSVVGDAEAVRHLRAGGESWAVWIVNDDGGGRRFVYRRRTGVITLVGSLRTDGTDFSERVVPLPPTTVSGYHVLETSPGIATFLFSDGVRVKTFSLNVSTNTLVSAVVDVSAGEIPSQFSSDPGPTRFWVRGGGVYVKVGALPEIKIIDLSSGSIEDQDVVRKGTSLSARYASSQLPRRSLALPFLPENDTSLCYNTVATGSSTISQGLPPGCVGYWTFDNVDFDGTTMLDLSGNGRSATLVGTQPASVAGRVGQARDFVGGSGNGHYSVANHSSLQITGDQTIAFWIRPDNFAQRVNPFAKAYGGEGTVTLETNGTLTYFYGTGGGDTNPYNGYGSVDAIPAGAWSHVAVVRDLTNRFVRLFINGKITAHHTAAAAPAAASGAGVTIGRGYTGFLVDGLLDEMVLCNQALSPAAVDALYAKGAAGLRASTVGTGSSSLVLDSSPNLSHAFTTSKSLTTSRGIAQISTGTLMTAPSWGAPSAMTIEARFLPRWSTQNESLLFSNYNSPDSSGTRLPGTVTFSFTADGLLRFRFETATSSVELRQTGGVRIKAREENYVAVSHAFGSGGSTFMVVNGNVVPAQWNGGGGSETPVVVPAAPSVSMNIGDEFIGLRVSSIAKTTSQILGHLRGRS